MANSMVFTLKNVIRNGSMPLTQINERIETLYLTGQIDAQERNDLIELMHSRANPMNELGDWRAMYEALAVRVNELTARIEALERNANPDAGEGGDDSGTEQYEQWTAWDGVNGGYQKGDIVMHNAKVWQSAMDGLNVWEPGAPGVDERYWVCIGE